MRSPRKRRRDRAEPVEIEFRFLLPSFPPTPIRPLAADEIGTRGGGARVFRGMFVADFVHLARHVESTDLPTILSRLFPFSSGSRSNLQFYSVFSFSIRPIPYDRPPTHPLKGPSRSRSSYIPFPPLFPPSPLPILFSITSTFLPLPGKRERACLSLGSIKLFIPSAGIITTGQFQPVISIVHALRSAKISSPRQGGSKRRSNREEEQRDERLDPGGKEELREREVESIFHEKFLSTFEKGEPGFQVSSPCKPRGTRIQAEFSSTLARFHRFFRKLNFPSGTPCTPTGVIHPSSSPSSPSFPLPHRFN